MSDVLEDKVATMLRSLTELVSESPQQLLDFYGQLLVMFKDDPKALQGIQEFAKTFIDKIPQLTSVVGDATKVLETFLTFKISKRQEEASKRQEQATEKLLKQNRLLSYSTLFLAFATFALVLVTVFHL